MMRSELAELRANLDHLHRECLAVKSELKFRALMRALKTFTPGDQFNEEQPRDWHGRWTLVGGLNDPRVLSDADPDPILPWADYAGDGHHYVPREIFNDPKYGLSPEARRVFENETTGRLNDPSGNFFDRVHRSYNPAVRKTFEDHLESNNIRPSEMTSEQAREFADNVKRSRDPAIRNLNMRIWMREIMHSLRGRFRGRE